MRVPKVLELNVEESSLTSDLVPRTAKFAVGSARLSWRGEDVLAETGKRSQELARWIPERNDLGASLGVLEPEEEFIEMNFLPA